MPRGVEVAGERVVGGELVEAVLVDAREELDGVAVDLLPEVGIEADEELVRDGRPGPPEVVGDVAEALERGGEARDDGEVPQRRHGGRS